MPPSIITGLQFAVNCGRAGQALAPVEESQLPGISDTLKRAKQLDKTFTDDL
ncbi:hypothetical protein KCP76_01360 [Salmonella enterica subsp. enterica serovar Weltevreden]|nr:hypothetical protein KCP76_01360 [Salmonella enterica subsp. enterica serovar Weltevreden]